MSQKFLTSIRCIAFLVSLAAIWWGPWWLPVILMLLISLRVRAYEALVLGVIMDFTWMPAGHIPGVWPLFTIGALVLLWAFEPLRRLLLLA